MRARLPVISLFLACIVAPAWAQLPESVARALKQAGIPESHVAIVVQDLDATAPILSHNAQQPLNPASVMKLVTTLAALDTLGPAYTFKTRVLAEGEIRDGVLDGNLVLQGGGDPALTLERFWLLLRELRAKGVREVRGELVIDASYYSLPPNGAPFDAFPLRPYNAAPSALVVNFNVLSLWLTPADGHIAARLEPHSGSPTLVNQLQTGTGACNGWRDALTPRLEGERLILAGRYPSHCGEQGMTLNLLTPEATAHAYVRSLWQELGGVPPAVVRTRPASVEARLLFEFDSMPLSQLVRDTNKHSNNLMAKMLLLNLGAARFGAPATLEKGVAAVQSWLKENGLDMPELVLDNGAGLSRNARISAASLTRLLAWAAGRPAYYEFAASLPAVGLEGTLKKRLPEGSPMQGQAWLKSGTLDNARNLAGYVLGSDGRRRVLVFLVNDPKAAAAGKAQEALLAWALKPLDDTVKLSPSPVIKQ